MIRFLLKGLLRDRSRSLFPVLMVASGAFLTVFLYCWLQGAMGDIVDSSARFDTGHVKIMTKAYEKLTNQMPNDLAILGLDDLLKRLRNNEDEMIWMPRIRFGGLLDIPDEYGETKSQGPVMGLGVNLLGTDIAEINILNLKNALVEGQLPQKRNEILISEDFAKKLGVEVGGAPTFLGSTMNGAMAMHNFIVSGMVRFGIVAMDKAAIIADMEDVQAALDMANGASEVVGYSKDMIYDDGEMKLLVKKFNEEFANENDEFSPIMFSLGQQKGLGEYISLADRFGFIIVSVFVFIMSLVLWNSGLMNGIRRYGEIGVRLAMGEPKGTLYRWMIFESVIIGIIGSVLGTLLGLAISYYMQYHGIDFGNILQKSTVLISSVIRAKVTKWSYVIGFFPGLIASVLGTMFAGIGIYKRQTAQLFKDLEV